jgi:imidazolonepropionase
MKRLENINILYTANPKNSFELLRILDAVLVWNESEILWIGERNQVPAEYNLAEKVDARNQIVIPALIDCHTHLAFGGNRWGETTLKIQGKSYLEIAESGGGIRSTVSATRKASLEELELEAQNRLNRIKKSGVKTIECKSGYGLNLETELKLLRVYKNLSEKSPEIRILTTLLAAHTVPIEFQENRRGYIDLIKNEIIPQVAQEKLATFFDVFVEKGAFSFDEAIELGEVAKAFGLKIKLHVDQLSHQRGAELSLKLGAISADHLEQIQPEDFELLKKAGTVAVSLPIASAYLNQPLLPARKLIEAGIPVAVATDFNPGSAPVSDLLYAMNLAVILQRMTVDEVLLGVTVHAAKALDLHNVGKLEVGFKPEFLIVEADTIEEWVYGFRKDIRLIVDGKNP